MTEITVEYDDIEKKAVLRFGIHKMVVRNVTREKAMDFAEGWRKTLSERSETIGVTRAMEQGFTLTR